MSSSVTSPVLSPLYAPLSFGRYANLPPYLVPDSYLRWLLDPMISAGKTYHIPAQIQEAARYWLKARRDGRQLFGGQGQSLVAYLVTVEGSLPRTMPSELSFSTLEEAFALIQHLDPDPEDDRILVWEVLPSGHRKVVWYCSGWHWSTDCFGELSQGCLPGHPESLYHEALARLHV